MGNILLNIDIISNVGVLKECKRLNLFSLEQRQLPPLSPWQESTPPLPCPAHIIAPVIPR